MVARCKAGNSWPPDLAEFVTLVADASGNALGLRTADVMAEYKRWRNDHTAMTVQRCSRGITQSYIRFAQKCDARVWKGK
jgi:hypothetical protein